MTNFIKDEFAEYYERPAEVQVDVTNRCNFDCAYCYNKGNSHRNKPELSDGRFLLLVDKIVKELNPVTIIFTGGEPLLRKTLLLKSIQKVHDAGIGTALNTNGYFLTESVIQELKEAGLDTIQTNLDACNAAVYQKLRGGVSSYSRQIETLKNLKRLFGEKCVTVIQVVTKENYKYIKVLANFIQELGLTKLKLLDFVPVKKEDQALMLTKTEWLEVLNQVKESREELKVLVRLCHSFIFMSDEYKNLKFPFCMAARFALFITADGSLFPCNHLKRDEFYCGNAFENNLLKLWQDNEMLNKIRYYDYSDRKCINCIKYKQCAGGCKALANILKGNAFAGDPSCDMLQYL
ncbi:MAG: radical SAM protein [Alphaproteobacteria bacterium]|nr:radical SAM protein [Alphaproteobacteria bacterium]